jgi:hypothetical protein
LDLQRVNQALFKEKLNEEEGGFNLDIRANIQLDADVTNQLLGLILDGLDVQVYEGKSDNILDACVLVHSLDQ